MTANEFYRSFLLLFASLVVFQNLGCGNPLNPSIAGGPCAYSDFLGTATVSELQPHDDGFWLVFDTKLTGEKPVPASYRNEGHRVLIKNPGGKTDQAWLAAQGVSLGSKLDVQVSIITSGTCTPIIFKFPKLPAGSIRD